METMAYQEALFKNARDAIVFAFQFANSQSSKSALADWINDPERKKGSGKGLIGLDGAAQAGMVLAELGRMKESQKAAIVCRYGQRLGKCGACGGDSLTQQWREARDELTEYVLAALLKTISPIRMRRDLVERHFGASVNFEKVAARHDCTARTVENHFKAISRSLDLLEEGAMMAAEDLLQQVGMVEKA